MGIKGLTGEAAWPRIGILRKGDVKKDERRPGDDLDQELRFVGSDESVLADWIEVFDSERVTKLTVRLPYATVDRCWHAWREHWVKGGLVCRCDGEEHVIWRGDDGKMHGPAAGEDVPAKECPGAKCSAKPVGRLEVVVPDLARMGVVTVVTTSIHDIQNIDGCLRALQMSFGDLSRIPLQLNRVRREISTPGVDENKRPIRVRRPKWLLHLEAAPTWVRFMLDAGGSAPAQLIEGTFRELPAPDDEGRILDEGTGELLPMPSDDPSDVPPPHDDYGAAVEPPRHGDDGAAAEPPSFTASIDACESVEDLRALWPAIAGIDQTTRKGNVTALWHMRAVKLLERDAWSATTIEQLEEVRLKITGIPGKTKGRDEALDMITSRRRELAGTEKTPAALPEHAMA